MTTSLRTATAEDADAYVGLRRVITPYQVTTAAATRHRWQSSPESARLLLLVAEDDGEVVGTGSAGLNVWTSEEGAAGAFVMVHPDHRGRGVGANLYDSVEWHLRDIGARRVRGWAVDDDATGAWCARRGFERTRQARFSLLDLTDVGALPAAPPTPDGVTVATFADVGPEVVFSIDTEASLDEPGDIPMDAIAYDQWVLDMWDDPLTDHDTSTVVLVDGQPAAYTMVEADPDTGRMWSGGTGTVRRHRGRGLAKIAKSVALRRAAGAGITSAYTSNDEENGPMLAINEWLGYRPCATQWSFIKALRTDQLS
jgi:GNAT superfamily N-acetyltransferase